MFEFLNLDTDTCFNSLGDATEYLDLKGHLEKINSSAVEMFEIDSASSVVGRSWLDIWDGPAKELAAFTFGKALHGEVGRFQGLCPTSKNNTRWLDVTLSPVKNNHGEVTRVICTTRDISEYKHFEQDLVQARALAEQKNKLKSQFVANVSHELRSPLTSVLGYADLLTNSNLEENDRIDYANRIKRNGEHLLSVLNDILDISKVESGSFNVSNELFDLNNFIQSILIYTNGMANKKGIEVELLIAKELPRYISSDELRLRQVLLNLLSNAIKFSNNKNVELRVDFLNNKICFDIVDHGIGMSLQHQSHLFNAYRQESSLISTQFGGTGLGLHLSKKLVRELKGDLKLISSEPGLGSHFRIELPLLENYERLMSKEVGFDKPLEPLSHLVKSKILVVDDALENRQLIGIYLDEFGVDYELAKNGREAVERCYDDSYDLVIMDILMPELNGLEATKLIRTRDCCTPIIALTAHAGEPEINKIMNSGFSAHVSKPFLKKELHSAIKLALLH